MIIGFGTKLIRKPKPQCPKSQADLLILNHYVGSHTNYHNDPFLGEVGLFVRQNFTSKTFFLNSTEDNARIVHANVTNSFDHDFLINSRKIRVGKFLEVLGMLLIDLVKFTKLTKLFYPSKRLKKLYRVVISSTNNSTLSILFAWKNFEIALEQCDAKFVLMPSEGNSHEIFFLDQIKQNYPHVRVLMYQHAPLVTDQPGFFQLVSSLREVDLLLLSSSSSMLMIKDSVRQDSLKCIVRVVGSSRAWIERPKVINQGKNSVKAFKNVLFLPEGTKCAVDELMTACSLLAQIKPEVKIRIRFHPEYKPSSRKRNVYHEDLISNWISKSDLAGDLSWADEVWFRASSSVDAALHLGLFPVHVNLNPNVDLNPIKFLGHQYMEVNSLDDIKALNSIKSKTTNSLVTPTRTLFLFEKVNFAELQGISLMLKTS